jgi:hypothetical protein
MLQQYGNAYCDTAFVPPSDLLQIASLGFKDRIIFGSDFPITHYFKTTYPRPGDDPSISLRGQYDEDIAAWKLTASELGVEA